MSRTDDITKANIDRCVQREVEHWRKVGKERTESQVRKDVEKVANEAWQKKSANIYQGK